MPGSTLWPDDHHLPVVRRRGCRERAVLLGLRRVAHQELPVVRRRRGAGCAVLRRLRHIACPAPGGSGEIRRGATGRLGALRRSRRLHRTDRALRPRGCARPPDALSPDRSRAGGGPWRAGREAHGRRRVRRLRRAGRSRGRSRTGRAGRASTAGGDHQSQRGATRARPVGARGRDDRRSHRADGRFGQGSGDDRRRRRQYGIAARSGGAARRRGRR